MTVSIFHRITGDGLAIVGTLALVWWLYAISAGPAAYESFLGHATSWYGYVVMIGLSWSFFQHLFSGLRHLVLDTGAGYELNANRTWSILVFVFAILATLALWGWIFTAFIGG